MPRLRATVQLNITSGLPEDKPTNTFHFSTSIATTPYASIFNALATFYDDCAFGLSEPITIGGHTVKMYDLADPEPRAPVYEDTFSLSVNPADESLPPEMAICLSFQGVRVSGTDQSRRRGRVYIGPLGTTYLDNGVPNGTLVSGIATAGDTLLTTSISEADWTWCVYSRVEDNFVTVANGWVDNAYDVQRRRGLAPTSRTLFP